MLEPSVDRRLPDGWVPPSPFPPLVVHYWAPRPPDMLWVMLDGVDDRGRLAYVAVGPYGKPAYGVRTVSSPGIPPGTPVTVCTMRNERGELVYGRLKFTLN